MLSQCYLKTTHMVVKMIYIEDKKLRNLIVKVPREHSSMLYFILESNDNLAFYSTLPFQKDSLYREVTIHCTPELSEQMDNTINKFKDSYDLEILEDKIIEDL